MFPGVDVNSKDNLGGFSPLLRAIWREDTSMVELLLRNAGVDANNIDDEGNTADVGVDAMTSMRL
jgi:ankyrin repeat protein